MTSRARLFLAGLVLTAACSGSSSKPSDTTPEPVGDPPPPPMVGGRPATTEIQQRQAAACEQLGPKITACAIADARATMSAEDLAKLKIEETAPTHTRKFIEGCLEPALSSRQVRVYEVCMREESECDALLACLEHVNDNVNAGAAAVSPAAP